MVETAERELDEIRHLVLTPTPGNFQAINSKLEALASSLSIITATQDPELLANPELRRLVSRLPEEMAHLRILMQAPSIFYLGLQKLNAEHFGAYERSGELRSLESKPFGRTLIHL